MDRGDGFWKKARGWLQFFDPKRLLGQNLLCDFIFIFFFSILLSNQTANNINT